MNDLNVLPAEISEESILAWRIWKADAEPRGITSNDIVYRLGSFAKWAKWPPKTKLEARCLALRSAKDRNVSLVVEGFNHEVPDALCNCGIYGMRTKEVLANYLANKEYNLGHPWTVVQQDSRGIIPPKIMGCTVFGRVSLWGEIIEGEDGYRAQYAYPYDLTVLADDKRIAASLREQYQVDVRIEIPQAQH